MDENNELKVFNISKEDIMEGIKSLDKESGEYKMAVTGARKIFGKASEEYIKTISSESSKELVVKMSVYSAAFILDMIRVLNPEAQLSTILMIGSMKNAIPEIKELEDKLKGVGVNG